MKRVFLLILLMGTVSTGCSRQYWAANFYMLQAENAVFKAYSLKTKKVSYEERLPYYRKACSFFLKAYELNQKIFTLNRIQTAADSCWRVDNSEARQKFIEFEEQYAKKHPTEYEYGDAGVFGVSDNV